MRTLLIVALVAVLMVAVGWMTFNSNDHSAGVEINTDKVTRDTSEATEAAGEAVKETSRAIRETVDESSD